MIERWHPQSGQSSVQVTFVSDLHLLANRSLGPATDSIIAGALKDADLCVWGGDLFDFRWTRRSIGESVHWAIEWLRGWASQFPKVQFAYLYGNHDVHAPFREALNHWTFQGGTCHPPREILHVGDTLFLHGDVMVGHHQTEKFHAYRESWAGRQPASRWHDYFYEIAVSSRIHRAAAATGHPHRTSLKHLDRYLSRIDPESFRRTRRVVFGHTHRLLRGRPYRDRLYYNPGAAIRHVPFEPVQMTIDLSPAEL